jgi:hypothetical protein
MRLVLIGQLQRSDQALGSIAIRMGRPSLELLDAVHAQPSLLREALLRQPSRKPMPPQEHAKRGGHSRRRHIEFASDHRRTEG